MWAVQTQHCQCILQCFWGDATSVASTKRGHTLGTNLANIALTALLKVCLHLKLWAVQTQLTLSVHAWATVLFGCSKASVASTERGPVCRLLSDSPRESCFLIRVDNYLQVVPMQCTENSGCFPLGKASCHNTALHRFFFLIFSLLSAVLSLCFHTTYSFTTDSYGIFNMSRTHLGACLKREGESSASKSVCTVCQSGESIRDYICQNFGFSSTYLMRAYAELWIVL